MLKEKLLNAPSAQLQNAVSDIIDKCRDIVRLEKVKIFLCIKECSLMRIDDKVAGIIDPNPGLTDK